MFERNYTDRRSVRLSGWNYASMGSYFITICTHHRNHFFGKIEDGIFDPTEIAKIVETEWLKTSQI